MSLSNSDLQRRQLLLAALLGAPAYAAAQTMPPYATDGLNLFQGTSPQKAPLNPAMRFVPYREIKPIARFSHTVVEIMQWSCPYCREINDGALDWASTLPPSFRYIQIPVMQGKRDARAAALFAGMQITAGHRLPAFENAMFGAVQDAHADPDDPRTIMGAAAAANLNPKPFVQAMQHDGVAQTVQEWAQLLNAARPTQTPTFCIGGQYVTDVGRTAGDYQKLFDLVGGLVSKIISQDQAHG